MFNRSDQLDPDFLKGIAFFEGFTEEQLAEVAALGRRVDADPGAELTDQGRFGDVSYVVVEGTANVLMNGEYVATVGPGTMVGEMALLEHRPRSATVVAETEMVLVSFGVQEFRELLAASPTANEKVLGLLNARAKANKARREP